MIPEKYQNESDYRNIPRKFLNSNIPQGRGMVKWAPFATLPEQFETIQQYLIDQNKIDRPILSDDQLNELNLQLHQALHTNSYIHIEYYQTGWLETVVIKIKNIDMTQMSLKGYPFNKQETVQLSLFDITNITPHDN
ncbi:MAG TPA: YolD-like family protein [Staphylococcus sp.]|nr:YolD-like family protein [Staphylococcus sp.]